MSVIAEFESCLLQSGFQLKERIVQDGKCYRCAVNDKPDHQNGWYMLFQNGCGVYGNWRTGEKTTFYPNGSEPQESIAIPYREFKEAQVKRREHSRQLAISIWSNLYPLDLMLKHPYLIRKQIQAYNLRVIRNTLVIPMYDELDQILSLQYISPDGKKRFLKGGTTRGAQYTFGYDQITLSGSMYLCEGFATGASIYEALHIPVICAFNTGNLSSVAMSIRQAYPSAKMIIAGDNDGYSEINPGKISAMKAAHKVNAQVILPIFTCSDSQPTDFNDLAILEGSSEVYRQLVTNLPHLEYQPQ